MFGAEYHDDWPNAFVDDGAVPVAHGLVGIGLPTSWPKMKVATPVCWSSTREHRLKLNKAVASSVWVLGSSDHMSRDERDSVPGSWIDAWS